ncbi:TPA: hypothetical protein ACH3X1_002761 [Trebouxia sp. C0004]
MSEVPATLTLQPDELLFSGVKLNQVYCQTVTITNPSKATVEATLRAGSSDRYTISPAKFVLKPHQSIDIDVRLRILRYAQKQKAVQQGQRDIFHIKAAYFEQKFYATFFLAPETSAAPAADSSQIQRRSERTRSADSRSPRLSPRDRSASNHGVHLAQAHLAAGVKEAANAQQDELAAERQSQLSHEPTYGARQPTQGPSSRSSTPDLSPRGDPEADDPPTPRMYRSIVTTAALSQAGQHHSDHSHSQKLDQSLMAGSSQMTLHQGHYDHGKHDLIPPRQAHAHEATSQQAVEDLQHTIRDKDGVIASLESQLAAARYRITIDERAAKVPSTVDTAGMSLQSKSQVEKLEVLNAQLEGSNAGLRDRVHQLSAQAEAAQAQAEALQGLQASLQDSAGPSVEALVEAAVGRERALQDTRNKKVLELLNNKDEVIQRLEDRCTEANAEIQQLREAMQETSKHLETADNRLASTMESRNKLRRQLDAKQAEMTTAHASLQADNEVLKDKLKEAADRAADRAAAPASPEQGKLSTRLRAELEVHKEALATAKEESASLASSLEKANCWIESLNNQIASKDEDLQAHHERCDAKDEQIAGMAQRVEQLESLLEEQRQKEGVRQAPTRHDWAVDVSLDQGMGLSSASLMPSSPRALRQRVLVLEGANEKLEKALMAAHSHAPPMHASTPAESAGQGGPAIFEATISSLRSMLSDREQQLSRLEADLAVARAYSGASQRTMGESAQGESALRIELDVLQQRLTEKEAQVVNGEERLSRLEAVHRVAQETALRSETQLESSRRSLIELDEDKQAGKEETESARALAMRLNARVSELTLAAECARIDGESARAELERVRSRHQSDIHAFEKRQKQLVTALKAVGGQTEPLALVDSPEGMLSGPARQWLMGSGGPAGFTPTGQPSDALLAVRDKNQCQAIQEADLAVAVMQAKLLEAVASQREAARQLQAAQEAFDGERAHLEQQVRRSKEEGSVRIQTLEDTIRKLGNRSDLHQELARLGGEASFLRRTEARLKSNLGFAEDRSSELQREVTILRQQVASYEASEHEAQLLEEVQRSVSRESSAGGTIVAKMKGITHELSSEGSQPHVVARLVERAEASEVQLAQAQQELKALKQMSTARAAAEGAGTSAAMSAAQVLEERTGDLHRQLLLAQSELKAANEDAHIQELDKAHLQTQLAEASREVAAAQSRLADKERLSYDAGHVTALKDSEASNDRWKEAAQAARQRVDAERRTESSQAAQQEAEQSLRLAQLEVARLKASLESKTKALRRAEQAALQRAEHAQHELAVARRECDRCAGDAEDRKVQLSVLVETVETLQAGTPGEKEQRIVSLTAQLTTARMKEAVSERRASQLQCELEEQATNVHKLQSELDKAEHRLSEKEVEASVGKASVEATLRDISALNGELKAHAEASAKAAHEVDDARNSAARVEAEATGLRAALEAARNRHFEQLTKERADAVASLRQARADCVQVSMPNSASPEGSLAGPLSLGPQPSSLDLAAGIDDLMAALKPCHSQAGGGATEDGSSAMLGDDDMPHRVVRRMKAMLLEAQALSSRAQADLRIAAAEAATLSCKLRQGLQPLEAALECRTAEKEAAVSELEAAAAINATRQAQAGTHADQHASLQARRLAALSDQLDQANAQVIQLNITLKHAHDQESRHKWQRDALQRKLAVCEADVQSLEARLSAAHMESAGTADASRSQTVEAAIQQRDSDIRAYFDTHVLKHVLNPDHQKRSLALTREICGLKVAHQQLIAAHAAAKKLAGAASLQAATLRQQLQALEERQSALHEARDTGQNDQHPAADASAQLASKAHEIYRLQEDLLHHRQKLANQEISVQELHAAVQTAKNKARQAEDDGHRTLEQARQQLASEFAAEREALLKEVRLTKQQQQEALAQAHKDAVMCQQDFAEQLKALTQQSELALNARPAADQYNQVVDAANAAHDRSQEMEADCHALQEVNRRLQSAVRSLEVQVSELQADAETRGSALESLEQTLGKIERSADSGRDRSPLTAGVRRMAGSKGASGGSRPGTASGLGRSTVSHADGAMAALSRQLVQAKMAEADAQRKHRVSARAELSLRQRLSQREDRISELKDALAVARSHQPSMHANHSRQLSPSPQHYLLDHMHQPQDRHYSNAAVHTQSEAQSPQGEWQRQRLKKQPEQQQPGALSPVSSDTQQEEEEGFRQTASPRGKSHHGLSTFRGQREEGEQGGQRISPRSRSYQAPGAVGTHKEEGEYVGSAVAARLPYFCPGSQACIGQSQSASEDQQGTHVKPQAQLADQPAKAAQNASGARNTSQSPRGYGSAQQLAGQVSDLKIELARRDAEVEYLEGQLAEAVAANRPHVRAPTDHSSQDAAMAISRAQELDAALLRLQKDCSQAVAAAQAVLGRPTTPRGSPRSSEDGLGAVTVQDVVQQLMAKIKDRDASVKRLRAVAKNTAEKASKEKAIAAAQPLEASQRAVIRDLSLRVANLTRINNQLKEERERAQERLRTLRASLGSSQLPPSQEGPHPQHPKPPSACNPARASKTASRRGAEAPSTSSSPQPGALAVTAYNPKGRDDRAAGDPAGAAGTDPGTGSRPTEGRLLECEAVQGLCQLLEHHVAVLEQSQEPVGSLLQSEATQAGADVQELLASSEAMVSQGARQALAAAVVAASAELAAMRSTLQVLSSHLEALHAGHTLPPSQDATAGDGDVPDDRSFLQAVHSPKPPMLALPAPPHHSRQHQETAVQTLPVALSFLSPEASVTQDELLAEQLQQAADRAQKWKSRCAKLRQELMDTQTSAAALEAALNERLAAVEKSSEEIGQQHRKEVSRLEAALAGAEAAKKQLGAQQAQHSTAGESDLQAANAAQAEADARASSLQRQIDTLRAQAAASRSGLQDEANSLKAALAKEKSERARIVLSLRDTITGLKQAGDVEGRLKAHLVQTHEDLAAFRATQEQMEARLAQKRSEVKSLHAKLEAAQRQLSQRTADAELANQQTTLTMTQAQHQITALEEHLKDSSARTADLAAKLTATEAELKQATESSAVMEREVARLEQVNQDVKAACQGLQATVDDLSREHHDGVSAKWEALLRCRRHRAAVHHMRGELQAAESENGSLSEELSRTRARGHQAAAEVDRLQKKNDDLQHLNDMERQQLAERHVGLMSELERRMEEERDALRREAAAMAASAAAAGEDRARTALSARLNEAQQSAFQDITNVANERRQLSGELEDLRSQFKAYQKVKTREICSLEHRVRILLQSQAVAGTMGRDDPPASSSSPRQRQTTPARSVKKSPRARYCKPVMMASSDSVDESDAGNGSEGEGAFPASYQAPLAGLMSKGKVQCASLTAAAEVGMALESEAVASAVREAEFERMQREAAEARIASLQDASEKLKQKLKAAQRELRAAKDVASCSAAQAAGAEASQQHLQHLQEQLQASQEALKIAKTESARRLKSLQSLQQQGSEGPHLVANAAFLAERTAKESAEGKLTTLRRSLAHKDDLLKTLKTKVDDLEAAVRAARAADHLTEVQAAESRVRSLQGSLSRKEDTIRELKERMEQACRNARDKGAEEGAERQLVSVKKLKGEVTRKEGMLKATQAELDKARQEIAEVAAAAQETAGKGQQAQYQSSSSAALAAVKEQARGVLAALRSLSKLVLRTSAAMQAAANSLQAASCTPSGQDEVSAAAVARMVDMSLEEVADLLGGPAASGPGDTDTALLAREAAQVLLQLEAAICSESGKSTSPTRNRGEAEWDRQALNDVIDSIQQQASRAEAVLADAISTADTRKHPDNHIAAHQERRRKKAAADPVARLEEDLLRASHGIEAELYQDL